MLINFSVKNFRSIRDVAEFSMIQTGLRGLKSNTFQSGNNRLTKTAVIYGPNASGKSGFLRAFKALEYLVLRSSSFKPGEKIAPYEPFKLSVNNVVSPVSMEIELSHGGNIYQYHVVFSRERIEFEELYHFPNSVRTLLFSRQSGIPIKFGESYKGGKKTIEKLLLPNQLFLSKAAENNVESVLDPFAFFGKGIMVFPFLEDYRETSLSKLYAKRLAENKNSNFSKRFNKLICALDTGIIGIQAEEVDWSSYNFPSNMPEDIRSSFRDQYKYDIKTQHFIFDGGTKIGIENFDIDEESTGTKSLFVIGGIILDALESGRVLIVDEFEKNMHPSITQFLINLFHNEITNPINSQLIFATHDITQLSNDSFRRDQVWFTEKDEFGSTKLFRCSDIKGIRLGTPLDKWYSSGRFGATPIINDSDFIIEMQSNDD
ncbi:MAG: AAA family ATPase [Bacteroidetes bacterium]|nr:AAA family ATPase [Bacteroidota bacterium]